MMILHQSIAVGAILLTKQEQSHSSELVVKRAMAMDKSFPSGSTASHDYKD